MMRYLTIKEALSDESVGDLTGHFIYLYRDDEIVFYVGRALAPCDRLREHMGKGRSAQSRLGMMIERHLPYSLAWTLELYTLADCLPCIKDAFLSYYQAQLDREQAFIQQQEAANAELERKARKAFPWFQGLDHQTTFLNHLYDEIAHIAEEAMIAHYHPCLNIQNNVHGNRLPEKYGASWIANQNMKRGKVE